jgi:histidyl-tRNA synthetase
MSTGPLPGFRDFYPEQYAERAFIQTTWRTVAARYGLAEYDGPPLESTELYTRKSGEEIVGQLYNFADKGGREIALRPEMTPTLARMVSARANALPKPVRWFSIPQLFRYERQQRGRLREHFQLNVDIVGEADIRADAELVACAVDMLREFGLTHEDIVVRFSDRRLLNDILGSLALSGPQLQVVYAVFDKFKRQPVQESLDRLLAAGLTQDRAAAVITWAQNPTSYSGSPEGAERIERYQQEVGNLLDDSADKWLTFDLSIVRGLAYYTGIVFEIFDRKGELRAICGGGRYDGLLAAIGGVDLPALGFGMGDVVLAELLRDRGLMPAGGRTIDFWVAGDDAPSSEVLNVVGKLRHKGRRVEYALRAQSLSAQLKAADRARAEFVAIVRPMASTPPLERITVRRLADGTERVMGVEQLVDTPPGFILS